MLARMIRLIPLLLLTATPALAADRSFAIPSFERIRVEGPFDVRLATGRAPAASATGDSDALYALDVDVQGTTLVVRNRAIAATTRPKARTVPTIVTLATPRLGAATVFGGGTLAITGKVTGQRVDVSVSGSGSLSAAGIEADQLLATIIGTGAMTLGGRAGKARLLASGAGGIDAGKLIADDLTVQVDGSGATTAAARYTANVTTAGIGGVTVLGTPACVVKSVAGGPIKCGR